MKRHGSEILGLLVLLACPASGQGLIAFSGNGGGTRDGGFQGTATFQLPLPSFSVLPNAPYAGQQVGETVQTLADGTHITRQTMGPARMTYRDSQGRIRIEHSFGMAGNTNLKNVPTLVQIDDPVSGFAYIMDDVTRVAHRIALAPAGQRPTAAMARRINAAATAVGSGGGGGGRVGTGMAGAPTEIQANRPAALLRPNMAPQQASTEPLGTQTIDGVVTQGTRITRVIPVGAQGNDGPITVTTDSWNSPDLHLILLTVTTDPRSGVQTTRYSNFSRAEPDPALFLVPGGYSIVDETGSFTIKWGEQ